MSYNSYTEFDWLKNQKKMNRDGEYCPQAAPFHSNETMIQTSSWRGYLTLPLTHFLHSTKCIIILETTFQRNR